MAIRTEKKAEAALARGRALLAQGRSAQAVGFLQVELAHWPEHGGLAVGFADALHASGRLAEAVSAYGHAVELEPQNPEAWFARGCAELSLKRFGAACDSLGRAAALAPEAGPVRYNLAKAQFQLGAIEAAIENFQRAAIFDPALKPMADISIATIIPGSPAADNAAVLAVRKNWAEAQADGRRAVRLGNEPLAGRKLRIGYASAFFGERNWIKPVMAMLNHHDRARFELHLISDGKPPSREAGYRDHDEDYVHDLRFIETDQAAEILAGLDLDILVDLNGYSFPKRLALMMRRPARHMVGWVNMFATTGIAAFDWIVGDATVLPADERPFYTEKIHFLPGTYMAFEILYPVPDVAPPPCVATGHVTFGCLGSHYKLTGDMLACFARILQAAPAAHLFIKNGGLDDASTAEDFTDRMRAAGIDIARVKLAGRSEHFEFLKSYDAVDIALDTFPYNGGTTTTEALWQGVPVLTFDGDRWASRTSKSLLLAADMPDWVRADQADYEARAVQLANDPGTPAMLSAMRAGMRAHLRASAVCDAAGMCRALETFYESITAGR